MAKGSHRAGTFSSRHGEIGYCFLLLAFFALGVPCGSFLSDRLNTADELALYLSAFLARGDEIAAVSAVWAAALYFRYPLFTILLGLSPLGAVFLPVFMLFLGVELSFSVSAFLAVFGKSGLWAALCVLGVRAGIVLPCCFALSSCAFALRRRREKKKVLTVLFAAGAILAAGIPVEISLIPRLLPRVLAHMNF